MSYIPLPIVPDSITDPLRHALKDRDPYVRKTAAICVAKVYMADPRRTERAGFVEMLRDLMLDTNATVVANAVAALSEIGDRQDGVIFKLNLTVANRLLTALGESSEYVRTSRGCMAHMLMILLPGGAQFTSSTLYYDTYQNGTSMRKWCRSASLYSLTTRTPRSCLRRSKFYCTS